MLADPLGNYSSRFRYRTVFLGGFVLAFVGLVIFFAASDLYFRFVEGNAPKGSLWSLWPGLLCLSLFWATVGVFLKAIAPLLTWQEAEAILHNTGYVRTVGEEGEVIFTKDKVRFVARNAISVVPERIECWNKGIRKLDVILRPRPAQKR